MVGEERADQPLPSDTDRDRESWIKTEKQAKVRRYRARDGP